MTINEQKQARLLEMLDVGNGRVGLWLNPRHQDVFVPSQFLSQHMLKLDVAYGYNLPAFDIDEEGVYAILSFGGIDSGCTLPWESIFAMTHDDKTGYIWPESTPPEVSVDSFQLHQQGPAVPAEPDPKPTPGWTPKIIQGGKS